MKLENNTRSELTAPKKRYDDACGTAHGLELIGDRWALLVLRETMLGWRRFSELRADLPGISANVLTQRLTELEERGIIYKRQLRSAGGTTVYEATEWGKEAEPILQEIGRWAARSPHHDPTLPFSGVSLMFSMRTMIDREGARGHNCTIGFEIGDHHYRVDLRNGQVEVERRDDDDAFADCDAVLEGPAAAMAAIIYGGQPLDIVGITGDRAVVERFVTFFPLPPKVGAESH